MEHACSHRAKSTSSLEYPLFMIRSQMFRWFDHQVGVSDVGAVVNCKADCDDVVDDSYTVECDVPEGKEAQQEEVDESDAEEDEASHRKVGSHDHNDDKNGCKCETHIEYGFTLECDIGFVVQEFLVERVGIADVRGGGQPDQILKHLNTLISRVLNIDQLDLLFK